MNINPNVTHHFKTHDEIKIGTIGNDAKIIIDDSSSVTISGHIGDNVTIYFNADKPVYGMTFFCCGCYSDCLDQAKRTSTLHILGNIGKNVEIETYSADIRIDGNVDSSAKITSSFGDIRMQSLGINSKVKTYTGSIMVLNGSLLKLISRTGNITIGANVDLNSCKISTRLGNMGQLTREVDEQIAYFITR